MRLIDPAANAQCHARHGGCECCGALGPFQAAHAVSRGSGGPTVEINLVKLNWLCHHRSHHGLAPGRYDLLSIIAKRYRVIADDVEQEIFRIIRLPKGSDPNAERPRWTPPYPSKVD